MEIKNSKYGQKPHSKIDALNNALNESGFSLEEDGFRGNDISRLFYSIKGSNFIVTWSEEGKEYILATRKGLVFYYKTPQEVLDVIKE